MPNNRWRRVMDLKFFEGMPILLEWSMGLCHLNADKYELRKGRKTAIGIKDERKAQTYRDEEERLKQLHRKGSDLND